MEENPLLSFSYRTKRGEKKYRQVNLTDIVDVKGWKAMGNKLGHYLRMGSFKWKHNETNSEINDNNRGKSEDELSLFT